MKKGLNKFIYDFNFATTDGVGSNLEEDEKIRLRLVNYLALISILNMLVYIVIYTWVNYQLFKLVIVYLILTTGINMAIIVINVKGRHKLAKLMLGIFTPLFMIFISTVFFGKAPGFQVFLFLAAMIPMFIWSYQQKIFRTVIIFFCVIFYIYIEYAPQLFEPIIALPENYISVFLKTNIAVCFSSAGIAIGSYQFLYNLKEQQLINQTKELKISQAHKDKIYSIIAHDLRGPFGSILGLTDILFKKYNVHTDERRLKILQSLHGTSRSLQSLLENLLNWSRMQSGNIKISLENLNLNGIIEESLSLLTELIQKKEIQLKVNLKPNTSIYADHHMVSTVLRNLISNSIKFTDQGGLIQVSAEEIDSMIHISVMDSGIGLSEQALKNLFDIENTDKISSASAEKGSGLGLLICKEFVENNGGKIWAESELGKGSTFHFSLPPKKKD